MKKLLALLMAAVMLLSLAACGGNEAAGNTGGQPSTGSNQTQENTVATEENAIQVDENLLTVEVTIAAQLISDMTEEDIKAGAEENGYLDYTINADGSVTYKMTKAKHREILEDTKVSIDEAIAGLLEGDAAVESFVSIDYNKDFSEFDVYVDPAAYTDWDSFYALVLFVSGALYQSFAGTAFEEIDVVVNFIDNDTKEVLNSVSYREFQESNAGNS